MSSAVPEPESYESDFGLIRSPGLLACLGQHILTKAWKYDRTSLISAGTKPPKVFIHAKKCPGCQVEAAINRFAEAIWLTGGRLSGIEIDPPEPGTLPQDSRVKLKLGPEKDAYDDF